MTTPLSAPPMAVPGAVPEQNGTTVTPSTDSTTMVMKTLRRLLLDFQNSRGESARDWIGERLFETRARDAPLVFPYAVMRLQTENDGSYHGMRLTGALEIQVHGRPWMQQAAVYAVCDLFDQYMTGRWLSQREPSALIFCHAFQRATLPPGTAAIDSEVITVRLEYTLAIWPAFLTSLTYFLPPTTSPDTPPPAPPPT